MFLKQAQKYIADKLNIEDNKMFESKIIIKTLFNVSEHDLILNEIELKQADIKKIDDVINLRNKRYPLQYILGIWEFYSLEFFVGDGVLIPRQDTETLCEETLKLIKDKQKQKIIDLCSGSGCIAITIDVNTNKQNEIFALEKSKKAIKYLEKNIVHNNSNVKIIEDDVINPKNELKDFDVIVSNPPYLSVFDMTKMQQEVSFEPKMALYAQNDGYYFYEHITNIWYDRLKKDGYLIFEIGINQFEKVMEIMEKKGFKNVVCKKDLNGIIRVISGQK